MPTEPVVVDLKREPWHPENDNKDDRQNAQRVDTKQAPHVEGCRQPGSADSHPVHRTHQDQASVHEENQYPCLGEVEDANWTKFSDMIVAQQMTCVDGQDCACSQKIKIAGVRRQTGKLPCNVAYRKFLLFPSSA